MQHSLKFVGIRGPRELPTTQTSQETHASLLPANTWKNLSSSNLSASPHLAPAQFSYSTPDLEIMAPHGRVCQLRAPSTTSPGSHPLWPWRLSTLIPLSCSPLRNSSSPVARHVSSYRLLQHLQRDAACPSSFSLTETVSGQGSPQVQCDRHPRAEGHDLRDRDIEDGRYLDDYCVHSSRAQAHFEYADAGEEGRGILGPLDVPAQAGTVGRFAHYDVIVIAENYTQ